MVLIHYYVMTIVGIDLEPVTHSIHNMTIIRTSPGNYSLALRMRYINGSYPIFKLNHKHYNFEYDAFLSDYKGQSVLYQDTNQRMVISAEERQQGIVMFGNATVNATLQLAISMEQCLRLQYLGVNLTEGINSSYSDYDKANNVYYINVAAMKKCFPGKDAHTVML